MRRPVLAAGACLLLVVGCSPAGERSPDLQSPADISLRPADLPAGLSRCANAGPIDGYLKSIKAGKAAAGQDLSDSWRAARSRGANAAEVAVYTDRSSGCLDGLIAAQGRSASSLVIRYASAAGAYDAFKAGLLGLPNPAADQQTPGLQQGVATGLGGHSWSYDRNVSGRPSYLALWQNGSFEILAATAGLSPEESRLAASSAGGRVR